MMDTIERGAWQPHFGLIIVDWATPVLQASGEACAIMRIAYGMTSKIVARKV